MTHIVLLYVFGIRSKLKIEDIKEANKALQVCASAKQFELSGLIEYEL